MIEEALRRAGADENIDKMLAEFLVHYEANIAVESRPFPGAVASLETLATAGVKLAVCTNKREYLTRKLFDALGLQHNFHSMAERETFTVSKPHPGHSTQVITLADGVPSRAIMVGDSDVDLRTAKAASVPSILVSFGYATDALHELAQKPFRRAGHGRVLAGRPAHSALASLDALADCCHRFAQFRPDCSQSRAIVESQPLPA